VAERKLQDWPSRETGAAFFVVNVFILRKWCQTLSQGGRIMIGLLAMAALAASMDATATPGAVTIMQPAPTFGRRYRQFSYMPADGGGFYEIDGDTGAMSVCDTFFNCKPVPFSKQPAPPIVVPYGAPPKR
jgi:hypothetical protein